MRNSIADTVKAATSAAAELRKREPLKYPPTPHSWYQLKGQEAELNAPVLCTSCFLRIDPEGEVNYPAPYRLSMSWQPRHAFCCVADRGLKPYA